MDKIIGLAGKIWLGLVVITLVSGCSVLSRQEAEPNSVFRPPTQAVSPTFFPATPLILVTPSPDGSNFIPTATPACIDSLTFVEDLTIPDGTAVAAGAVIDKRWRVKNSGTCNWSESYTMQHTAGPELGAPQIMGLYPARSNAEATLRIEFIAPDEIGTHRSAWQAYNPQGQAFGDPFYIEFVVSP